MEGVLNAQSIWCLWTVLIFILVIIIVHLYVIYVWEYTRMMWCLRESVCMRAHTSQYPFASRQVLLPSPHYLPALVSANSYLIPLESNPERLAQGWEIDHLLYFGYFLQDCISFFRRFWLYSRTCLFDIEPAFQLLDILLLQYSDIITC